MLDSSVHCPRHRFPAEIISYAVWHYFRLDEVFVKIGGKQVYLWRAVGEHGQVLDILVQEKRDTDAAERFFRRLFTEVKELPERIITDELGSYSAAKATVSELQLVEHLQVCSDARLNNRVEQSHQPTRQRERRMQGFPSLDSAQDFLLTFSRFCNHFRLRRHLLSTPQYRNLLRTRFVAWHEVVRKVALN